jgi:tellurite resistance protein
MWREAVGSSRLPRFRSQIRALDVEGLSLGARNAIALCMAPRVVDLTHADPSRLKAAVRKLIEGQSVGGRLRAGAGAVAETGEGAEARYFQSILELGYLIASADGFAAQERDALAEMLEQLTTPRIDRAELKLYLEDLEEACQALGRRERLRRAAADFEDAIGRNEALGFAALVALADGQLGSPELAALAELGAHFELDPAEVDRTVDAVVRDLSKALG